MSTGPVVPTFDTGPRPTGFSGGTGLVVRCAECAGGRHDRCLRRRSLGDCRCYLCHTARIMKLAALARDSPHVAIVRASLVDLMALQAQRVRRRKIIASTDPVDQGVCAWPPCGARLVSSPYGAHKRWCGETCRKRAYRAKKRRSSLTSAPTAPYPARFADRQAFLAAWGSTEN